MRDWFRSLPLRRVVRRVLILCLSLGLLGTVLAPPMCVLDPILGRAYSKILDQDPVRSASAIRLQLQELESMRLEDLEQSKWAWDWGIRASDRHWYKNQTLYRAKGLERYDYLVGRHRVDRFLSRAPRLCVLKLGLHRHRTSVMSVQPDVLVRLLKLEEQLRESGLNANGFVVNSGFRTPAHNRAVGGAKRSRHLIGRAIDLYVGDVDRNGAFEKADQDVVYRLLTQQVIGSDGFVKRYPAHIHFDLSGDR